MEYHRHQDFSRLHSKYISSQMYHRLLFAVDRQLPERLSVLQGLKGVIPSYHLEMWVQDLCFKDKYGILLYRSLSLDSSGCRAKRLPRRRACTHHLQSSNGMQNIPYLNLHVEDAAIRKSSGTRIHQAHKRRWRSSGGTTYSHRNVAFRARVE